MEVLIKRAISEGAFALPEGAPVITIVDALAAEYPRLEEAQRENVIAFLKSLPYDIAQIDRMHEHPDETPGPGVAFIRAWFRIGNQSVELMSSMHKYAAKHFMHIIDQTKRVKDIRQLVERPK